MSFFKQPLRRDLLNQYASVVEQILMSGSNMLTSIVVLKIADVAQFGIYSFVFVLSTLVGGVFGSLLHRQMMLQISAESIPVQRRIFLATIVIELIGLLVFLFLIFMLFGMLSIWFDIYEYQRLAIAATIYIVLLILFDAFKQYSYTTENQVYSLRSTCVCVVIQIFLMGLILWIVKATIVVEAAYAALSVGLLASLMANNFCRIALSQAQWINISYLWEVLKGFFSQGRFSLIGMTITWGQNQSINPILMLISGPTIAGYFSLGRLMIMPMAVVSQGLVNSSTPMLRRLYKRDGAKSLDQRIITYIKKTSLFSMLYMALLLLGHFSGFFYNYVPEYQEVQWYLMLWIVLVSCSILRFWRGQFFVVSMKFKFLLNTSITALCITLTGMLVFGVGVSSVKLALISVVAGELATLAMYHRQHSIELKGT